MRPLLDEQDWKRLREVFVPREECNDTIDHQNRKFANDDKRLAVIENNTKIILGILSAVGVGVFGIFLEMVF